MVDCMETFQTDPYARFVLLQAHSAMDKLLLKMSSFLMLSRNISLVS